MADIAPRPPQGIAGTWDRLARRLGRSVHLDLGGGAKATVLLAGSGRSGTTWLAEALNHGNGFRYLFEPAHPDQAPYASGLPVRVYARPGAREPRLDRLAGALAEGKARDRWTDQYNAKLLSRRRLVKDIWVNLLLGWLAEDYPDLRVILLLRHPCAAASSQFATQWGWRAEPASFLAQPQLVEDHLTPYRHLLAGQTDPFDDHVITWCVENLVPLRQLPAGRARVAFYEHLLSQPERELPPLFAFAGQPWTEHVLASLRRPSSVARAGGTISSGGSPVEDWRGEVSEERLLRAGRILAAFGMDRIYRADDPMPLVRADDVLGAFNTG